MTAPLGNVPNMCYKNGRPDDVGSIDPALTSTLSWSASAMSPNTQNPSASQASSAEEWRVVPEFDDYEVSSLGRVRRAVPDRLGRNQGMILKLRQVEKKKTTVIRLVRNGRQEGMIFSRLVCSIFHGPSSNQFARHINGDWKDNRACNLVWVDDRQDIVDAMVKRGSHSHAETHMSRTKPHTLRRGDNHPARICSDYITKGEDHRLAVLTEEDVRYIRATSRSVKQLASFFGVADFTIRSVRKGRTWKHVK